MKLNLENKQKQHILLIAPKFYDYHEKVKGELIRQGNEVTFFENKFFREDPLLNNNDLISKAKRILNPRYKSKYHKEIVTSAEKRKIDLLFCIGGFSISPDLITTLRLINPKLRCVLYFWDSFGVWDYRPLISVFDKVFTFDRDDAETYGIDYLPLFYSYDKVAPDIPYKQRNIDLLFVGSVGYQSMNRLQSLKYFHEFSNAQQLNSFFWLYCNKPKTTFHRKMSDIVRTVLPTRYGNFLKTVNSFASTYDFIKYKPIESSELAARLRQAKCVIDIPVSGQVGLTMRTIETLASGTKLITTNDSIVKEPFYNSSWILIVKEENINVNIEFLSEVPKNTIDITNLHLSNWIRHIINSV